MRKILLGIILLLLLILGVKIVTGGIEPFGFKIQSLGQIEEASKNLKAKIEEANRKIETEYKNKRDVELQVTSNNMLKAKKEYLEYVNRSSNEEILAAKTLKSYAIEFLWMKLGTHAREEGVNITLEIGSGGGSGGSTMNFIVEGSYIAITNFVYAIENDSDLDFRIQNFKLLPYEKEILEATFSVTGVTIEGSMDSSLNDTTSTSSEITKDSSNTSTENTSNTIDSQNTSTNVSTSNKN